MKKKTKIIIGLFIAFVVFAILHNAIYGLFRTEEGVFFILSLLCGAAFIIFLVYGLATSIIYSLKNKNRQKNADESKIVLMYGYAIACMIAGIIFNISGIGRGSFAGFNSMGNWLLYIGFAGLILAAIKSVWKTKRVVDERMHFVAAKANRITFLVLIIFAFIIIIIDGIQPITIPYHLFMSYLISGLLLIYAALYKILLKYH